MKKILSAFYWKTALWAFILITSAFVATQFNHYLDLRESYLNTAQRISRGLSSGFSFFYHNAQNISYNPSLREMDRWAARDYFNSLVALYPDYDMIILSDKEGKFVMSNTIGSEGEALDYRKGRGKSFLPKLNLSEDLQKGFIGTAASDFNRNDFVSEIYGHEKIGMSFSAPVLDKEGELVGHVTTFINQTWLQTELEAMTEEFFATDSEGLEVFVSDKSGRTLASNSKEEVAALENIPFKIGATQFIAHTKEGDFQKSAKGFLTFLKRPFFAISEFNHKNFLSDMGWSLILRMDKQTALASILNSVTWFGGAFSLFLAVALGLRMKASSRIEREIEQRTGENELALRASLKKNKKGGANDVKKIAVELATHIDFEIPHFHFRPQTVEAAAKDMEEDKSATQKFKMGAESLKKAFESQSGFKRAVSKRKLADHEQERIESSLTWNLSQAEKLLKNLKLMSLNLEISSGANAQTKSREIDEIVQQAFIYFEEAKKMSGSIARNREKASRGLDEGLQEKVSSDEKHFNEVKESFDFARNWSNKQSKDINFYRNREGSCRREFEAFNRKRGEVLEKVTKLRDEINKLEDLVGKNHNHKKHSNKKAA